MTISAWGLGIRNDTPHRLAANSISPGSTLGSALALPIRKAPLVLRNSPHPNGGGLAVWHTYGPPEIEAMLLLSSRSPFRLSGSTVTRIELSSSPNENVATAALNVMAGGRTGTQ